MAKRMEIGGRYNWRGQPARLIYLGRNWSGNGYWHQFSLVSEPDVVWCEVTDSDLDSFEVSMVEIELPTPPGIERGYDRHSNMSPRQQRKARKAAQRAQALKGSSMSCEMCTDPDGAACFPLYGIGPHIHKPGGGTILLPGAAAAGYTENPNEPGHGWHWCPHCGDGKPEWANPSTPILKGQA